MRPHGSGHSHRQTQQWSLSGEIPCDPKSLSISDPRSPVCQVQAPLQGTLGRKTRSRERNITLKHKQIRGNVPGLGGWPIPRTFCLCVCFSLLTHLSRPSNSPERYLKWYQEIFAYMIYSEGPDYPEYVMHIFLPKVSQIREYVRSFSPSWLCPTNNRKLPQVFGLSAIPPVFYYYIHILIFLS